MAAGYYNKIMEKILLAANPILESTFYAFQKMHSVLAKGIKLWNHQSSIITTDFLGRLQSENTMDFYHDFRLHKQEMTATCLLQSAEKES